MFDEEADPELKVEPTWEYITDKLKDFQNGLDGIYSYVAAAIAHDHQNLKPKDE